MRSNGTQDTSPELKSDNPILNHRIRVSTGRDIQSSSVETTQLSVSQLIDQYFSEIAFGQKVGPYIMASAYQNGMRKDQNATETWLVIFDIDNGTDTSELRERIEKSGYLAVLHNSHSHASQSSTKIDPCALSLHVNRSKNGLQDLPLEDQVRDYLSLDKGYAKCVVDSVTCCYKKTDSHENKDGDVTFTEQIHVEHNPIHKTRIVFVLSEPLKPEPEHGQDALKNYKSSYEKLAKGLAFKIGIDGYDNVSAKLTQAMYLPRVADRDTLTKCGHVLEVINRSNGTLIDPKAITPPPAEVAKQKKRDAALRADLMETYHPLLGEDLFYKLRLNETFRAGDFLEEFAQRARLEIRKYYDPETGKASIECPFEAEQHTPMDGPDMGFYGIDHTHADVDAGVIGCRHDHCSDLSSGDFLKVLLHRGNETSFLEVLEYCDCDADTRTLFEAEVKAYELLSGDPLLKTFIESCDDETSSATLELAYRAISLLESKADRSRVTKALSRKIGSLIGDLRADIKAVNSDRNARIRSAGQENLTVLNVDTSVGFDEEVTQVIENLHQHNSETPTLFRNCDGSNVRRTAVSGAVKLELISTQAKWLHVLAQRMNFINGEGRSIDPPRAIIQYMQGANNLDFPEIVGIATVPIFDSEGVLRTETGYNPELKVWLQPRGVYHDVPDEITEADLVKARTLLLDIVRDIPFSDDFDGDQPLAQYLGERDEAGHRQPNLDRGKSSRANFIAFVLQPFAQGLVKDNLPFYVITKPKMGTGASLLASICHIIQTGDRLIARSMADTNQEFEKQLLSALVSGDATVTFDNVKNELNSPSLEAAATSGTFKGRQLGQTAEVFVSMKQKTIAFTGNNVQMTDELRRRVVPIYLDAATPEPSLDRDPDQFKYSNLDAWCLEKRADLVWACHILIKAWVQNGKKLGAATMPSFDHYAEVLSGILENAGIEGFLDNRAPFMETECIENDMNTQFIQAWWDKYEWDTVDMTELLDVAAPKIDGGYFRFVKFELPIQGDNDDGLKRSLGKLLSTTLRNQTFRIRDKHGNDMTVRHHITRKSSPVKRALMQVKTN